MAEKKQSEFTVTDKRKFTLEGDLKPDTPPVEPEAASKADPAAPSPSAPAPQASPPVETAQPQVPSAAEQQAQEAAYKGSTAQMDSELKRQLGGRPMQDFEVNFERFLASLYMTALVQLGLAHEQGGQPRVDLLGARNSIDTITLLQQKTKGNLTFAEQNFLENVLYELRMAYVEVTNALTRPPQPGEPGNPGVGGPFKK